MYAESEYQESDRTFQVTTMGTKKILIEIEKK